MSEIVILYILCRYDATIYKISKIMQELFFAFLKPSLGTINPAVKKLKNLGCIEIQDKMSQGGMASKFCSITPFGKKYLKTLLLGMEFGNPAHVLNNVKIALFCADVLDLSEKEEFLKNIQNHLILYKGRTLEAAKNPYIDLNGIQKKVIELRVAHADEILKLI